MQREIRRCRDHLVSIGTGFSLFGIWTIIKILLGILVDPQDLRQGIQDGYTEEEIKLIMVLSCIIIAILFLALLGVHLYIGLSARAEGLGGKQKKGYLIATVIFSALYSIAVAEEIIRYTEYFETIGDAVITASIDITLLVTLGELMYNAIRVRKLSRQLAEQG